MNTLSLVAVARDQGRRAGSARSGQAAETVYGGTSTRYGRQSSLSAGTELTGRTWHGRP